MLIVHIVRHRAVSSLDQFAEHVADIPVHSVEHCACVGVDVCAGVRAESCRRPEVIPCTGEGELSNSNLEDWGGGLEGGPPPRVSATVRYNP